MGAPLCQLEWGTISLPLVSWKLRGGSAILVAVLEPKAEVRMGSQPSDRLGALSAEANTAGLTVAQTSGSRCGMPSRQSAAHQWR